jgi:glycopeptide antibiotics resistance protein
MAAAFAVYVSLVPFEFVAPHGELRFADIVRSAYEVKLTSRGNFFANVLLFVPIGFFGVAAVVDARNTIGRWIAALALILPLSLALSVGVESLQIFVRGRTPSALDVVAQTIGATAGVLGWAALGRQFRELSIGFFEGSRSALDIALLGYVAYQTIRLLEPLDVTVDLGLIARKVRSGGVVWNPLASPVLHWASLPAMLADVLFAVPVGVAAMLVGTRPGRRRVLAVACALVAAFFIAGELAQVLVQSRTADIVDLLMNVAGGIVGVALARITAGPGSASVRPARTVTRWVWSACLAGAMVFYVMYQWSPYDFTWSRQMLSARIVALYRVPFVNYYHSTEMGALSEAFLKIGLGVPLGVFFSLLVRPQQQRYGRILVTAWSICMATFFSVVELGQCLLPTRYPDNTDVLLAVAGVWIGTVVLRPFTRSSSVVTAASESDV